MVLLKGMEWQKSDVALKKLKEMLWGLEALRVFDDKLTRALQEIKYGKEKTKAELARVSHPKELLFPSSLLADYSKG
jgi:hypothetical protein